MRIKLFKKKIFSILSLILCSVMLVSCGEPAVSEVKEQPVTISFSWWGNDPRHLYTMDGVDMFMQQNEDIRVKMSYSVWSGYETKMDIYMKSHTASDVMQINFDWLNKYSSDGEGYYDLNELSDIIDLSTYDENELSYGMRNGKLNAVPIAFNTPTLYYNKKVFDEHGLSIPKTWNDLFSAAEVLKKDNIAVLGMPQKHLFLLLLTYYEQEYGKPFFNEDGTLSASVDEIQGLLEFYKKCVDANVLIIPDKFNKNSLNKEEIAGTVAWVSNASDFMDVLKDSGGEPCIGDYIRKNESDTLTGWYIKPATMYAISSGTKHPEEAAKLLNFLINSPDMAKLQKTEKGVPASQHAFDAIKDDTGDMQNEIEASQKMDEVKKYMKTMIPSMENNTIIDKFTSCANSYIFGAGSLEDNANELYETVNEVAK